MMVGRSYKLANLRYGLLLYCCKPTWVEQHIAFRRFVILTEDESAEG